MKLITFITILFITLNSISQERMNREKITFNNESNKLTNSTGWIYNNELGEWIYRPDNFSSGEYFLLGRKYDFTKFYFETDKNNFDKILINKQ